MIRHLLELATFLLLVGVGVGLVAAFVIGLLWIWRPTSWEETSDMETYGSHPDFLAELVACGMLSHGPPSLPEALNVALSLDISDPFGGPWGFPTRTQFYDWERDCVD